MRPNQSYQPDLLTCLYVGLFVFLVILSIILYYKYKKVKREADEYREKWDGVPRYAKRNIQEFDERECYN